jgi:hypothetical protein
MYIALVGGSLSGTTPTFSLLETNGSSGVVDNGKAIAPTSGSLSSKRDSFTATLSGGGTVTNIQPRIRIGYVVGTPIDITLRIGLPQLELGAFATSPILTTTAAATRAADVAVMQGANFSNWFSQPEGTFYVEWNTSAAGTNRYLIDAQQVAGSGNRIDININTSNVVNPRTVVGGSAVASLSGGTYSASSNGKIAFAYKSADYASSFNGASAVIATTAGALPTPDILYIGSLTGTAPINGYIRRISYFTRRLADAELQGVTA